MNHDNSASRRQFLKTSASLFGTLPLVNGVIISEGKQREQLSAPVQEGVRLDWLTPPLNLYAGATVGITWPRGKVNRKSAFEAVDETGKMAPIQSWPLAYWPDGSLKWTGHAVTAESAKPLFVRPAKKEKQFTGIITSENDQQIIVDTGVTRCVFEKNGEILVRSIFRSNNLTAKNGRVVLTIQDQPDGEETSKITKQSCSGNITSCVIEQRGPLRAVVKITGTHRVGERDDLIPFTIRFYFFNKSESIRMVHTIVYNADEQNQFIKGLGIAFDVPLTDKLYNRHVRFTNSEHDGLFAEAVQGLTGLRRDPGDVVRKQQRAGQAVPPESDFNSAVPNRIQYIPAFGDFTLFQGNDQSFVIRKRTKPGHTWLTSASGKRASGLIYCGTPKGGLALGVRNFWQSYPGQLDIRNATSDTASVTAWLWAPDAPAMDMRFYHDGMGQDTFSKQLEGLEITYEDYEKDFGRPEGVARTSELTLWALDKTPDASTLLQMTSAVKEPPLLVCDRAYLASQKVFGGNWSLVDRTMSEKSRIEDQLDRYFDYYKTQIDIHHWYGFWNYGDFMHSYDTDRHTWRYDVGGFAWDNSELSTDLWLWYYFLHTGRGDVFRVAEAMTRHTGEVDVHHLGRFAPLGSRHNVMHWGCSAKQLRISTAANRRIYYYLTADERVGDLLDEQVNAVVRLKEVVPGRKLPGGGVPASDRSGDMASVSFGTDWGAVAAAWLTRWERTEDPAIKDKLLNSMRTIGEQPRGFFTGSSWLDLSNGKFKAVTDTKVTASHLSAVFGLTEICEELILLADVPAFSKAWVEYCKLYNASEEEQQQALGQPVGKLNLGQGHSRLTAYAANYLKDESLAKRAWTEFYAGKAGITMNNGNIQKISGPEVLVPLEEDRSISTNAVAQWGLAALQCLALVGDHIQNDR